MEEQDRGGVVDGLRRTRVPHVEGSQPRKVDLEPRGRAGYHRSMATTLCLWAARQLYRMNLLITAGALVNDNTIRFVHRADMPRAFTYFHIETEAHDVVLANGAASETFVDERDRANFDNYAEYVALYGDARTIAEIDMPRISTARLVPAAIQHRLATPIAA